MSSQQQPAEQPDDETIIEKIKRAKALLDAAETGLRAASWRLPEPASWQEVRKQAEYFKAMTGHALCVHSPVANRLRKAGVWDDEYFAELKPSPINDGAGQ